MVYNQDIILFVEQKMQLTEKFVSIELMYYELSQLTQQQTINRFWKCIQLIYMVQPIDSMYEWSYTLPNYDQIVSY